MADNHLAAVNQIAIFKNSYWINDAEIDSIAINDSTGSSDGEIKFEGNLKFKKDLVLFRERHWDFGLALLSSRVDRYIKIDEYSAKLINEKSNSKNLVKVEFSGIAYDEDKLILFENNLKQIKVFVKNVSISHGLDKEDNNKIIKFEGEMELELF